MRACVCVSREPRHNTQILGCTPGRVSSVDDMRVLVEGIGKQACVEGGQARETGAGLCARNNRAYVEGLLDVLTTIRNHSLRHCIILWFF